MKKEKTAGHCYCGAISFKIEGKSEWIGHCHCESCRRASGSVMTTFAGYKKSQVTFTGETPASITTGDGVTRSFCARCGSPIAYENSDTPDDIHLQLGLFDDLDDEPPGFRAVRNPVGNGLERPSPLRVPCEWPTNRRSNVHRTDPSPPRPPPHVAVPASH